MTLEDGIDKFSRNVGNQQPTHAAVTCLKSEYLSYATGEAWSLTLSVTRTSEQVEWEGTVNEELKSMWKEAVVAWTKEVFRHILE